MATPTLRMVSFRLPPRIWRAARAQARQEGRTLTYFVRQALEMRLAVKEKRAERECA